MLIQLAANGLVAGAVIGLLGCGFSVMYSGCRCFAFSFGTAFTLAAYTVHVAYPSVPLVAAAVLGTLLGAALGILLEAGLFTLLRRRGSGPMVLMLASIGVYVVFQNLVSLIFTDATLATRDWPTTIGYEVLGTRITGFQYVMLGVSSAVACCTLLVLRLSPWGQRLRAVASDPELAAVAGIHVSRVRVAAAGLGSGLAAIAGVLVSLDTGLVPSMGFQGLLWAILACVIGGLNRIPGAIAGGVILGLVNQLGVWKIGTQWQDTVLFAIMIGFLLIRPQGLFGLPLQKATV